MNKRGQIEQVFFYIFAIIVTAFILFLGIKGISYVMSTGSRVEIANFETDINSQTKINFNLNTGSITEKEIFAPTNLDVICFVDPGTTDFSIIKNSVVGQKISGLVKTGVKDENVYFSIKQNINSFKVENIKTKNGIQCKENPGGRVILHMENKGSYTEVSLK